MVLVVLAELVVAEAEATCMKGLWLRHPEKHILLLLGLAVRLRIRLQEAGQLHFWAILQPVATLETVAAAEMVEAAAAQAAEYLVQISPEDLEVMAAAAADLPQIHAKELAEMAERMAEVVEEQKPPLPDLVVSTEGMVARLLPLQKAGRK